MHGKGINVHYSVVLPKTFEDSILPGNISPVTIQKESGDKATHLIW